MIQSLRKTYNDNAAYAKTLCGPRSRGSTTKHGLFEIHDAGGTEEAEFHLMVDDREMWPIDGASKGAKAWKACIPQIDGRIGASAYNEHSPKHVKIREGDHGPELVSSLSLVKQFRRTSDITFIIGPAGDLWTWFPGPVLDPYDPEKGPQPNTAVKFQ